MHRWKHLFTHYPGHSPGTAKETLQEMDMQFYPNINCILYIYLVIDFGRDRPRLVLLGAEEVEVMEDYIWGCGWTTSWTGRVTQSSFTRRLRAGCIPEEATILQHLQEAPVDVLSLRSRQRSFLRCGVLGREHITGRNF